MAIEVVQGGGDHVDYHDVVSAIDLRALIAPGKPIRGDKPVTGIKCFMHHETQGSLAVFRDGCYCFGCGHRMTTLEWIAMQEGIDIESRFIDVVNVAAEKYAGMLKVLPRTLEKKEIAAVLEPMSPNLAMAYHSQLGSKRDWYRARGLSDIVIDEMQLGHTGRAFSIPVWSASGQLQTIRYRRDDALRSDGPKYWGTEGRNPVWLFNEKALSFTSLKPNDFVVAICEGELDALRLWQEGIAAVSATNGAGAFDEAFVPMFRLVRQVLVCLDQDEPGQENAVRVAKMFRSKAKIVKWDLQEGKDVTEYLKKHTVADWRGLITGAQRKVVRHWGTTLREGYWNQ